jgi:hypothetical protein
VKFDNLTKIELFSNFQKKVEQFWTWVECDQTSRKSGGHWANPKKMEFG